MIRRSPSSDSYALLARMILEAAGIGGAVALVACGGDVRVDSEEAASGSGAAGGESSSSSSSSGPSSSAVSSSSGSTSSSAVSSSSGNQPFSCNDPNATTYACADTTPDPCPAAGSDEAMVLMKALINTEGSCPEDPDFCFCSTYVTSVPCGPDPSAPPGQCCYFAQVFVDEICMGRPFTIGGEAQVASLARGRGWTPERARALGAVAARSDRPDLSRLDAAARRRLADEWSRDALFEHASVASFARFALELMAAGAPAELVRAAHRAMGEEIRHAELCFGLASAFAGEPVSAGPLPVEGALEPRTLAELAAAVVREGCVGETIAAMLASAARDAATDAAARAALEEISADEASHAALAWRTVAWACERGGAEVRRAVEAAFASAAPEEGASDELEGVSEGLLRAFGRLSPRAQRAVAARAYAEVVQPCARALLSRRESIDGDADTLEVPA